MNDLTSKPAQFSGLDLPSLAGWVFVAVVACWMVGMVIHGLLRRSWSSKNGTSTSGAAPVVRPSAPGDMTRGMNSREREFLPAALEILETPPSPVRVAGLWLICAAFSVSLAWAYFGKLDIHAIAQGRIQPSGRSKVVQSLEPGKVVAILVENGSQVKVGDTLLELDPTESGADREAQTRDLESARAEAARRTTTIAIATAAESKFAPLPITFDSSVGEAVRRRESAVLAAELAQLKSNRASLTAQYAEHLATHEKLEGSLRAREKVIALAKERVVMRTTLNDQGSLSRALVIEVQSQYETQVSSQVSEQGQLIETEAQIKTTERKIEEAVTQFVVDQTLKLADVERKADRLAQDLVKATAKNERARLRAPITGTVQQLAVTTVGQVVNGGQSLMTVVPSDGPIEIEAMIQNQDIGFVEAGQEAVVKIEAFPFTRFGTLPGRIFKISRDAVDEREAQGLADPGSAGKGTGGGGSATAGRTQSLVFPATIRLDRSVINVDGKDIPLTPGMVVSVEVLTGQRRAIDYVLSPLREVTSGSGKER
jgi:hemolysin D